MRQSIQAAVRYIASVEGNDFFRDRFEDTVEALEDFDAQETRRPPPAANAPAPHRPVGYEWALQMDPFWNAYYLALVIELGHAIEAVRIPTSANCIFSYRFIEPEADGQIFDSRVARQAFLESGREAAGCHTHVVMCDLSDFCSRVYRHRVEEELKRLGQKSDVVGKIIQLLQEVSRADSRGLPGNGPASCLLAELALNSVDQCLWSKGARFCRHVDHYVLFCKSQEEAKRLRTILLEKLSSEGMPPDWHRAWVLQANDFLRRGGSF